MKKKLTICLIICAFMFFTLSNDSGMKQETTNIISDYTPMFITRNQRSVKFVENIKIPEIQYDQQFLDNGGVCNYVVDGVCLYWHNIYKQYNVENDIIANSLLMAKDYYPKNTILHEADARASAFLYSITKNKNLLPEEFPVGLFLAMGYAETGYNYGWSNEIGDGGIMQVEYNSGFQSRLPYTNTLISIENNVLDSIDTINFFYERAFKVKFTKEQYSLLHGMPNETYYGDHLHLSLTILAYNSGFDPIRVYGSGLGNSNYVYSIANKLKYVVSDTFGSEYASKDYLGLAEDLFEFQNRIKDFR